jgi:phospholipid-binding lipoprotein MlaA
VRRPLVWACRRLTQALMLGIALGLLSACASAPSSSAGAADGRGGANGVVDAEPTQRTNPTDPWEAFNRRIFVFNDAVDQAVLAPVARGYVAVVPQALRQMVRNAFGNVGDVWSALNHVLQGKFQSGAEQGMRVLINTTLGVAGLADVASEVGLPRQKEDLGQTVGAWGVGSGPYLMLPLLGPSTLRDTAVLTADRQITLPSLVEPGLERNSLTVLDVVSARAAALQASNLLGQVALDRYSFLRDAYIAKRRYDVYDGQLPEDAEEDEPSPR